MKGQLAFLLLPLLTVTASATVRYVDLNCANPTAPYLDWSTAGTNIQDAVDAATAGDEVLVTNGVYRTGGQAVVGTRTNRVAVTKEITLRSLNGPAVTLIEGYQVPGTTNGEEAVRCVYLTNNTTLTGFTLTNGATRKQNGVDPTQHFGGGVWSQSTGVIVSNCVLAGNAAQSGGGGAYSGTLINCILTGNSGGGAIYSVLKNCTITGNTGSVGGGAAYATLINCAISGNSATEEGGGVFHSTLTNCVIAYNSAPKSGGAGSGSFVGAVPSTLYHCLVVGNHASSASSLFGGGGGAGDSVLRYCIVMNNSSAGYGGGTIESAHTHCLVMTNTAVHEGGGAYNATAINCAFFGNTAQYGGGVSGSTSGGLTNCTVVANSATNDSGGVKAGLLRNCIVYYNTAPTNPNCPIPPPSSTSLFVRSCTFPLSPGTGNISNAPAFVDLSSNNLRLQSNSPCIDAGSTAFPSDTVDLDGRTRVVGTNVDMGAYEFQAPGMGEFIASLQSYGLPTDGSADFTDDDSDAANNWQEWVAGTVPTNSLSVLKMLSPSTDVSGLNVSWQSVSNRTYYLQRGTDLGASPAFSTLGSNIVGQPGTTVFTDSTATNSESYFYRVGVQ